MYTTLCTFLCSSFNNLYYDIFYISLLTLFSHTLLFFLFFYAYFSPSFLLFLYMRGRMLSHIGGRYVRRLSHTSHAFPCNTHVHSQQALPRFHHMYIHADTKQLTTSTIQRSIQLEDTYTY